MGALRAEGGFYVGSYRAQMDPTLPIVPKPRARVSGVCVRILRGKSLPPRVIGVVSTELRFPPRRAQAASFQLRRREHIGRNLPKTIGLWWRRRQSTPS